MTPHKNPWADQWVTPCQRHSRRSIFRQDTWWRNAAHRVIANALTACALAVPAACIAAPLTNADVTKLLAAGLGEGAVVATISSNGGTFDTSADALIALKRAGASDAVIQALLTSGSGAGAPKRAAGAVDVAGATSAAASGGNCVPEAPEGAIIWIADGARRLLRNRAATVGHDASMLRAVANAFTAGIVPMNVTSSVIVAGARSSNRITDRRPTFRDLAVASSTEPFESFVLARPDISNNERRVHVGEVSISLLGGSKTRTQPRPDQVVELDYETVVDYCTYKGTTLTIYSARPKQDLAPGEYVLMPAMGGQQVFEFGVE